MALWRSPWCRALWRSPWCSIFLPECTTALERHHACAGSVVTETQDAPLARGSHIYPGQRIRCNTPAQLPAAGRLLLRQLICRGTHGRTHPWHALIFPYYLNLSTHRQGLNYTFNPWLHFLPRTFGILFLLHNAVLAVHANS